MTQPNVRQNNALYEYGCNNKGNNKDNDTAKQSFARRLCGMAEGYSEGHYRGKRYGMTKTTCNQGATVKFYARELGGNDFISLNYYLLQTQELLKPCEMSESKVIDFIQNIQMND